MSVSRQERFHSIYPNTGLQHRNNTATSSIAIQTPEHLTTGQTFKQAKDYKIEI